MLLHPRRPAILAFLSLVGCRDGNSPSTPGDQSDTGAAGGDGDSGDTGGTVQSCTLPEQASEIVVSTVWSGLDVLTANFETFAFDDETAAVVKDGASKSSATTLELAHIKWFTPLADSQGRARMLAVNAYDTNVTPGGTESRGATLITADTFDIRATNLTTILYGGSNEERFGRMAVFVVDDDLSPVSAVLSAHTGGDSYQGGVVIFGEDDLAAGVRAGRSWSTEGAGTRISGTLEDQQFGLQVTAVGQFFPESVATGSFDYLVRAAKHSDVSELGTTDFLFSASTIASSNQLTADDADATFALQMGSEAIDRGVDLNGDGFNDLMLVGAEVCIILGGTSPSGVYTDLAEICDGRLERHGSMGVVEVLPPQDDQPALLFLADYEYDEGHTVIRVVSLDDIPMDGTVVQASELAVFSLVGSEVTAETWPQHLSAVRTSQGTVFLGFADDEWDEERGRVDVVELPSAMQGEIVKVEDLPRYAFEGELALDRMGSEVRLWQEDGCVRVGVVMYNNNESLDNGNPSILFAPATQLMAE